jgi:hypothetical protein
MEDTPTRDNTNCTGLALDDSVPFNGHTTSVAVSAPYVLFALLPVVVPLSNNTTNRVVASDAIQPALIGNTVGGKLVQ